MPKIMRYVEIYKLYMEENTKFEKQFVSFLRNEKEKFQNPQNFKLEMNSSRNDFIFVRIVGTGAFGKVFLAIEKGNNKMCAIKALEKRNIVHSGQMMNTKSEIAFMRKFHFPFLITLNYLFMDNVYVYIVMPYVTGGEMYEHLRKLKKFDEFLAKFYAAQIILAFDYMHTLGVVYRDLKPENILLDSDGYIKVGDLGFAKKIDENKTYTFCGTPEYLAPEIILNKGYDYSVDWWTLGILIYEMTTGNPPFMSNDALKLYEKIVSAQFVCPTYFSKPLRHLLSNLIIPDRTKRIGAALNGTQSIRSHDWFRKINFSSVLKKTFKPPYIPQVTTESDDNLSNCETTLRSSLTNEFPEFDHINVL